MGCRLFMWHSRLHCVRPQVERFFVSTGGPGDGELGRDPLGTLPRDTGFQPVPGTFQRRIARNSEHLYLEYRQHGLKTRVTRARSKCHGPSCVPRKSFPNLFYLTWPSPVTTHLYVVRSEAP